MHIRIIAAVLLVSISAHAAPPPEGSADWQLIMPHKGWIESQKQPNGASCCDWADGRPVDAEIRDGHWWAHVTPAHWPGVLDQWIKIPDDRISRIHNPVGVPILWLRLVHEWIGHGGYMLPEEGPVDNTKEPFVYCFAPANDS